LRDEQLLRGAGKTLMARSQHERLSCRELIFMVMSDELMSYFNLYRKSPGVRFQQQNK